MEINTKTKIIVSIVAALVLFAAGRWTAPVKTVVEKQIVEVEKKQEDSNSNKHKETTTKTVEKPDGTKETTTTTTEDTTKNKNTVTDSSTTTYEKKETIKSSARLSISALAGANIKDPAIVYGLAVKRDLIGPISVGIFGFNNGLIGGSVGLEF